MSTQGWNCRFGNPAVEMKIKTDNRGIKQKDTWDFELEKLQMEDFRGRISVCVHAHVCASMNPLKHKAKSSLQLTALF